VSWCAWDGKRRADETRPRLAVEPGEIAESSTVPLVSSALVLLNVSAAPDPRHVSEGQSGGGVESVRLHRTGAFVLRQPNSESHASAIGCESCRKAGRTAGGFRTLFMEYDRGTSIGRAGEAAHRRCSLAMRPQTRARQEPRAKILRRKRPLFGSAGRPFFLVPEKTGPARGPPSSISHDCVERRRKRERGGGPMVAERRSPIWREAPERDPSAVVVVDEDEPVGRGAGHHRQESRIPSQKMCDPMRSGGRGSIRVS